MGSFDAAGFLISLSSMSFSVSLLLGGLALCKEWLLTRYRAGTLYLLGILLTALMLFPWRPALLLPKITLPAIPVMETVALTEDASLPLMQNAQASIEANDTAAPGMIDGVSLEAAAVKTTGDAQQQAASIQAATPSAHQKSGIPWALVLFVIWLVGALALLLFQMIRHARFLRLNRRWKGPVPQKVLAALSAQCAYLRISQPPAYTTPCVKSPTLVGLLHPTLLMPEIEYDPQQLNLMLTHELIHLKHGHLWGKALGCLNLAVHWFNPLMPYLMREMGAMCEMACDEAVLKREEPEHRSAYVDAILSAALLTKAVRTPLCSPFDGGVKQMKQIRQRIGLMTPFRPRRMGAGFIVITLLLALLTGSVLAGEVPASTFVIPESDWITSASEYMPQADYDLLMSMQTPGWEELTTEECIKQITPQLPKLKEIMNQRWPENRFMRHFKYSMAEAGKRIGSSYQVWWNTQFYWDNMTRGVLVDCDLNWRYLENVKLTNGERDKLLDDVLVRADRAVRELKITEIQEANSQKITNELGVQLNEIAMELGGNALSIWFTSVRIFIVTNDDIQLSQEQQEFISLLAPEGYRDQTVADYQAYLEKNKDRFDPWASYEARQNVDYETVYEAYLELRGYPTYLSSVDVNPSLMPAWTMRGSISYLYQLDWKTVDPNHITVGERHDAISKLITRISEAAADIEWEAKDWETFDNALKERLPMIAQEESTSALTFTVSNVGLELMPLATEEYVHSEPINVLKAFMTACFHQDTEQMAAVCAPVGTDAKKEEASAAREDMLKSFVEMYPINWKFGEVQKESGKDDDVTVDLTFYLEPPKGAEKPGEESRQARLTQIDGKWYLVLESLQI